MLCTIKSTQRNPECYLSTISLFNISDCTTVVRSILEDQMLILYNSLIVSHYFYVSKISFVCSFPVTLTIFPDTRRILCKIRRHNFSFRYLN